MALVRTARLNVTSADAFGTGTYTPASFTPSNSSLLAVVVQTQQQADDGISGADLTLTDSAGLTWTKRVSTSAAPAGWSEAIAIFTAPVTTGTSMTVSADAGAFAVENYRVDVYEYTSNSGGTLGTGATASGSDADGNNAASITLSASPASSSEVLAAANVARNVGSGGSVTEGAGWTELIDVARNDWWNFHVQVRGGSTSTSVDWADLEGSGGATGVNAVLAALEITETGSDTTAPTLSSPTGTETGSTTAQGQVSTDEANGTMYAVVSTSATPPSVAQIQAGNDSTVSAGAWSGNQSIASTGTKTFNATGLTASTSYYFYFQHRDAAANDSTVASSAQFTTDAATVDNAVAWLRA